MEARLFSFIMHYYYYAGIYKWSSRSFCFIGEKQYHTAGVHPLPLTFVMQGEEKVIISYFHYYKKLEIQLESKQFIYDRYKANTAILHIPSNFCIFDTAIVVSSFRIRFR